MAKRHVRLGRGVKFTLANLSRGKSTTMRAWPKVREPAGLCPKCTFGVMVKVDGTIRNHRVGRITGTYKDTWPCMGAGMLPIPLHDPDAEGWEGL